MHQLERARAVYRPNRTLGFNVPASEGHDDLLMSLALLSAAVKDMAPRVARGSERADTTYDPKPLWTPRRVAVQQPLFTI